MPRVHEKHPKSTREPEISDNNLTSVPIVHRRSRDLVRAPVRRPLPPATSRVTSARSNPGKALGRENAKWFPNEHACMIYKIENMYGFYGST